MQATIADLTENRDIETTVRMSGPLTAVDEAVAEHATSVITEAVSNAVRHSGAAHLTVEITVADELTVVVVDDGCGIDPAVARRSGLANMQRRAELVGGSCVLSEQPNGGTRVRWAAPCGRGRRSASGSAGMLRRLNGLRHGEDDGAAQKPDRSFGTRVDDGADVVSAPRRRHEE